MHLSCMMPREKENATSFLSITHKPLSHHCISFSSNTWELNYMTKNLNPEIWLFRQNKKYKPHAYSVHFLRTILIMVSPSVSHNPTIWSSCHVHVLILYHVLYTYCKCCGDIMMYMGFYMFDLLLLHLYALIRASLLCDKFCIQWLRPCMDVLEQARHGT
jgi:hypothetical protein